MVAILISLLAVIAFADAASGREGGEPTQVLIISEDRLVLHLLRLNLESRGLNASAHASFAPAVEEIRERHCDLVIADISLPGVEGFEVCRMARAATDAPILALSTFPEPRGTALASAAGADRHLSKPFGIAVLIREVYDVLGIPGQETPSR
ncbi:MAG: response regulator [Chloroflexi bacterium]|nr:response regulator [Chloroflexota bacterium]